MNIHKKRRHKEVSSCSTCLVQTPLAFQDEIKILDHANHTTTLQIKEAMHISLRDPKKSWTETRVLTLTDPWKISTRSSRISAEQTRTECRLGLGDVICWHMVPDTSYLRGSEVFRSFSAQVSVKVRADICTPSAYYPRGFRERISQRP